MSVAAATADLPDSLEPELATLVEKPRPGDWLYEIKFDGYRMLARVGGPRDVRLITRRGNDWTPRFKRLQRELVSARLPPGWYDGEIVMLDAQGKPSFNALQNAIEGGDNDRIVYYLFDAPFLDGRDLRRLAVEERRARLQAALKETDLLRFSREIEGNVHDILATACKMGLEGVIGKRRGSSYVHRRSEDWIKLKCTNRQEFVIGGYTDPEGARIAIGALLVGYFDDAGVLQYAGKVGTGFSGETLAQLRRRLDAIAQPQRPFATATGHDRRATWVRPELVCEVTYNEWPEGGRLRHASFQGLREDRPASAVVRERSGGTAAPAPSAASTRAPVRSPEPAAGTGAPQVIHGVAVTHGDRVIDPSTGFTKLDLVRYYADVAPWALPHLKGRPLYLKRAPLGIMRPMIFQQHPERQRGLRGTDPKLWPGHQPAISIESAQDLVSAAQLGGVELHTWNSTAEAITKPDRLIFDLDPGQGVPWGQVQEAAQLVRALLEELGLKCWLKTTGGKGFHVMVPLKPQADYDTAKGFTHAVVQHIARALPERFVAKSGPSNRVGRIFIDYLRNGQSQSTAEAFSARARPGMGVSMPVSWEELKSVESGDHWNIKTAVPHLSRVRKDPWAGCWKAKQSLKPAMKAIGYEPKRS
jgi:bifunctional non-homologous end joining protein LigD